MFRWPVFQRLIWGDAIVSLIQTLKEKSEADRQRFEAELPVLAERVAHGEATEKEVAAWVKASGKSLDDLQAAVDRQLEIDRLRDLAALFRERSLAAYRNTLEIEKYRQFTIKTQREFEHNANHLRSLGWQVGLQASESQEAYRKLAEMTGEPFRLPNLTEDYRALDAAFAVAPAVVAVVAEAVAMPAAIELPSVP